MATYPVLYVLTRKAHGLIGRESTEHNVNMRMLRVSMDNGRPFEWPANVTLDRRHDISSQAREVYAIAELWGQDKLE